MVTAIDRSELLRLVADEGGQIVDVLPATEFAAGHVPGASNIPLKSLDATTVTNLNKTKPVAVY